MRRRPLRILLVNAHGTPDGGTETGLAELARALIANGVDVSFLHAFPPADLVAGVPATVLHQEHWRTSRYRRLASHVGDAASWPSDRLEKSIQQHRPDVVHTHNLPGIGTGIWEAARRRGIPVVHTLHDYHLLCPRTTLMRKDSLEACRPHPLLCGLRARQLGRWTNGLRRVLAVSQHLHQAHGDFFDGVDSGVMRNPIRPSVRPLSAPGPELRSIGYIGALHPNKGVDVLLDALPGSGATRVGPAHRGPRRSHTGGDQGGSNLARARVRWLCPRRRQSTTLESCDIGILPSIRREPGEGPDVDHVGVVGRRTSGVGGPSR